MVHCPKAMSAKVSLIPTSLRWPQDLILLWIDVKLLLTVNETYNLETLRRVVMESILEECEELPTRISVSHICQNLSVKGDIIVRLLFETLYWYSHTISYKIYAHNTEIIFADTIGEITKKSSDPIGTIQQVRMCSLPSICIVVVTTDVGIQVMWLISLAEQYE